MTEWMYIVVLLSFLLLFFLLWKEWSRKNKSALTGRIMATVFAVASLACLAFPLYYNKKETGTANHEAIILTEGFSTDSVNKFLSANNSPIPFISLHKNIKNTDRYNAQYIADASLLANKYKNINAFHVFGFGLEKNEMMALPGVKFFFHQAALPSGITGINWNQKCKMGEPVIIQGTCNNTTSSKAKLVLSNFSATLDSAFISANKNGSFTLSTIPKGEGRTAYTLAVITGKDTIEQETIPVQAEQGLPVKIILLSSSPDFENRFLKNSLSKAGYEVAARTTISKNKYAFDYLNTPAVSLQTITSSLLDKLTVLIADAAELSSIPKSELAIIQSAVSQKSMGLIVKADSVLPSPFYAANFPVSLAAGDTQQQLTTFLYDTSGKLPALTEEYPLWIKNEVNTQPLVRDKQNKIYVSSALYGSGKIIFTTLPNTYTWALSGHEESYHTFWSVLLNKAATNPQSGEAWSISPRLPLLNTPVQLQLQTSSASLPQGQVNGTPVYLKANPDLPYQWSGIYYPAKEGWQTVVGLHGTPFYWYAYRQTDWQNVQASQKILAMQQYISPYLYGTKKAAANLLIKQTELPKLYFFLLFLLCCGFLWAESKGLFTFKK